jgi:hypothetical protein
VVRRVQDLGQSGSEAVSSTPCGGPAQLDEAREEIMRTLTRGRAAAVGVAAAVSMVLPASVQAIADDQYAPTPTADDTVVTPTADDTVVTPTADDTVVTPTAGDTVVTPPGDGTARTTSGRRPKRNVHGRRHSRNGAERRRGPAPTRDAPTPTRTPTGTSGRKVTVRVTSFGFNDNDDGNGHFGTAVIAYPTVHSHATESSGRFDDPITFASDAGEFAPGTMIYVPYLQKYFVMEDGCVACSEASDNGIAHVDLWMGPSSRQPETVLRNCQNAITRSSATIEVSPKLGRPVDTTPMFTDGRCTVHLH